jgi:hypothetical protein
MKLLRQRFDAVFPGDFGRRAVFAAVKQQQIRAAPRFKKMSLDVADTDDSMLVTGHGDGYLQERHAAIDGDGLAGHEIAHRRR